MSEVDPKTGQSDKLLLAVQERGKDGTVTEVSFGRVQGPGGVVGGEGLAKSRIFARRLRTVDSFVTPKSVHCPPTEPRRRTQRREPA